MICYFVPGIILDHFTHPKSVFWYRKLKILWTFTKKTNWSKNQFFHIKIDFSIKNSRKKQKNSPIVFLIGLARDQWTLPTGWISGQMPDASWMQAGCRLDAGWMPAVYYYPPPRLRDGVCGWSCPIALCPCPCPWPVPSPVPVPVVFGLIFRFRGSDNPRPRMARSLAPSTPNLPKPKKN